MGIPLKMTFSSRLRRLDRWVRHTRGTFPQQENGRLFHKELAPLDLHPAGDEMQLNALRKAIAQAHIDVAANFMAARPREALAKVAAVVRWPSSEWSQVCVFFDLDYFKSFEIRDGVQQRWTPLSVSRNLSRELGLRVPVRLRERGYHEWRVDPAADEEPQEGEVWLFGD
jgi:Protein of unknown function (DUF3916)